MDSEQKNTTYDGHYVDSSPLFMPQDSPPLPLDFLEDLVWPNGERPDLLPPPPADDNIMHGDDSDEQSLQDPSQVDSALANTVSPSLRLPQPAHADLVGYTFSFESEREKSEVGQEHGEAMVVEQQQREHSEQQHLAQDRDVQMDDAPTDQQHHVANQPHLSLEQLELETDQEREIPSFATIVNQPQSVFDQNQSEPDEEAGIPSFATNVNQPQFTFDEPRSEPDREREFPSFATNVDQPDFTFDRPTSEPVEEQQTTSAANNANFQHSTYDEAGSHPAQETRTSTSTPNLDQDQPSSEQSNPEQNEREIPFVSQTAIEKFLRLWSESPEEEDHTSSAVDNTDQPGDQDEPAFSEDEAARTLLSISSGVSRPELTHEPSPRPHFNPLSPFTSGYSKPTRATAEAEREPAPRKPHNPLSIFTSKRERARRKAEDEAAKSSVAAEQSVPEQFVPASNQSNGNTASSGSLHTATPRPFNATSSLQVPAFTMSSTSAASARANVLPPPRPASISNTRTTESYAAPAGAFTRQRSDPTSLIAAGYAHLNRMAASLRAAEAEACDREESIAELLARAQELRETAIQERKDGLVVIRDRRRKLEKLEGKSVEYFERHPQLVNHLRPLKLGEVVRGTVEFAEMEAEWKRLKAQGEEDGYETDPFGRA